MVSGEKRSAHRLAERVAPDVAHGPQPEGEVVLGAGGVGVLGLLAHVARVFWVVWSSAHYFQRLRTAGWFGRAPAAPGSGFGSVTHDTTVRNGVETRQTAAGSRPFGPKSLTRVSSASGGPHPARSLADSPPIPPQAREGEHLCIVAAATAVLVRPRGDGREEGAGVVAGNKNCPSDSEFLVALAETSPAPDRHARSPGAAPRRLTRASAAAQGPRPAGQRPPHRRRAPP